MDDGWKLKRLIETIWPEALMVKIYGDGDVRWRIGDLVFHTAATSLFTESVDRAFLRSDTVAALVTEALYYGAKQEKFPIQLRRAARCG